MTEQELAVSLKNLDWAIGFMLDNNYEGVLERLRNLGINVSTKKQALSAIRTIVLSKDEVKIAAVFSTPYNNQAANGTGGFADYFRANTLAAPPTGKNNAPLFNWDGLFDFLGGGFSSLGNTGMGTAPGAPKTPEQIKAEAEAEEAKRKAERQQQTVTYIVFGVIIIVIIVVVAMVMRGNKKKAE